MHRFLLSCRAPAPCVGLGSPAVQNESNFPLCILTSFVAGVDRCGNQSRKRKVILTEVLRDFIGDSVTVKFLRSLQAQLASFLRFITSPHRGTRSAAPSCSAVTTNSAKKLSHAY